MDNGRTAQLERRLAEAEARIASLDLAVRMEREKLKVASDNLEIGLWEFDVTTGILYQNKKLGGIYESDLDPITNFREAMLNWNVICSADIPLFHKFCDALDRGDPEISFDIHTVSDFNEITLLRYEGRTVFNAVGEPVRVVGRTTDITEACADSAPVPAAPSKEEYSSFIEDVNARLSENSGKESALILFGIDRFQELSSRPDYDVQPVTAALRKMLETYCAVEQGSIFAQLKDGVFAVYMRFTEIPRLNAYAARIIYKFNDMNFSDGATSETVSISAGIALFRHKDYDTVCNEAHTALRAAHFKGGNGFQHYNASMQGMFAEKSDESVSKQLINLHGADKIYRCINIALTDEASAVSALNRAAALTAEYTSCTTASFRWLGEESETILYGEKDADVRIFPNCNDDSLTEKLSENECIILAREKISDQKYGFSFSDNGVSAAVLPIVKNGKSAGYFTFVAPAMISWQAADINILNMIKSTVESLIDRREKRLAEKRFGAFAGAVINDLNIEGFTIVPDTFEIDYIGEATSRRNNMCKGDVCYKKLRGINAPCGDCPVHQLASGQISASTAHYRESDNRWIEVTASRYEAEDGSSRYAISRADVTNCISNIRTRDVLTGLLSFDSFSVDAMKMLAEKNKPASVAVISVANFRQLNETTGYETGDSVIIAAADALNNLFGKGEPVCRVDGARFAVLFSEGDSERACSRINSAADAIQACIKEKCSLKVNIISGVYTAGNEETSIMAAFDRAILAQKTVKDKAYYTSNMTVVYDDKMNGELLSKQFIESHMVEALENNEFKVFYQPKVDPATGRIAGAEALVRWIRPDGEIISPGRFIPLFERNGFISDMDFAVYRNVISDIRKWQSMGIDIPTISLNVSRDHLSDDTFVENICVMAFKSGVSSSRIELEITESMLNDNMSRLIDTMAALKDAGFKISIDDFGSGYSSLNLIALLPCDTLKIDGGFFLKNELTDKNKAVIASVIELAKKLKFTVVSEGVETDEQVEFLRRLECELIQGYYYYKPMPPQEFEKLLIEQYG